MICETATDRALRGVPSPSEGLIIAEMDSTMTDTENQYMTLQDVAARLQLSLHTVRAHEREGLLRPSRLGRRLRVSEEQFADYIARLEARGAGAVVEGADQAANRDAITAIFLDLLRNDPEVREILAAAVRKVIAEEANP